MTFDEWWKIMKPAECDELKEYFVEAYQLGHGHGYTQGVSMFHEAVKIEREECAKICEGQIDSFEANRGYGPEICAEAIRARSNDRVEGRDAASSRRVPSHDGLAGKTVTTE